MKKITIKEFENIVNSVNGTAIMTVQTRTDARLLKTDNPFGNVNKFATKNGIIGFDYQGQLDRIAEKEGLTQREAKPRQWGTVSDNGLWVEHKGKRYLRLQLKRESDPRYFDSNGKRLSKDEIAKFIPKKSTSSSQEGFTRKLIQNDIDISNIVSLKFRKEKFVIIH